MNRNIIRALLATLAIGAPEVEPKPPILYWRGSKSPQKERDKSHRKHRSRTGGTAWKLSKMVRTR